MRAEESARKQSMRKQSQQGSECCKGDEQEYLLQTLALQTPAFLRSKQASPFSLYFVSPNPTLHPHPRSSLRLPKPSACISPSDPDPDAKPKLRRRRRKTEGTDPVDGASAEGFVPRKPRRDRRSESAAVEDFVRLRLQDTFTAIREQNAGLLERKHEVLKARRTDEEEEEEEEEEKRREGEDLSVEDDDPEWPLDAEVRWGIRASEYFEKNPIKNVVEEGVEIDWEGEMDEGWVKEINSLEWESFAYHPSPLVVLVFERYRSLARQCAQLWLKTREALGHPLGFSKENDLLFQNLPNSQLQKQQLLNDRSFPLVERSAGPKVLERPGAFVLEIGTEEMPPHDVVEASNQLRSLTVEYLKKRRLSCGEVSSYGTPHRLVEKIHCCRTVGEVAANNPIRSEVEPLPSKSTLPNQHLDRTNISPWKAVWHKGDSGTENPCRQIGWLPALGHSSEG
ncbi:hypothetical protein ZIOFF_071231 [Zingiber officinale]|uniref:Uncharacterized protein n=1 Tax=Zingiber officinale TaxID=94328 RepID=A0A8J5EUC2_ZINOF|nr:hypothetical protein ZIOFF_071231 [Zingiber officinale]